MAQAGPGLGSAAEAQHGPSHLNSATPVMKYPGHETPHRRAGDDYGDHLPGSPRPMFSAVHDSGDATWSYAYCGQHSNSALSGLVVSPSSKVEARTHPSGLRTQRLVLGPGD